MAIGKRAASKTKPECATKLKSYRNMITINDLDRAFAKVPPTGSSGRTRIALRSPEPVPTETPRHREEEGARSITIPTLTSHFSLVSPPFPQAIYEPLTQKNLVNFGE